MFWPCGIAGRSFRLLDALLETHVLLPDTGNIPRMLCRRLLLPLIVTVQQVAVLAETFIT